MKFKSVLHNSRDLKKNGYKIIRKLHKMETRKGADNAYQAVIHDSYYFVAGCRALINIIKYQYPEAELFEKRCDGFIQYLEMKAETKSRLQKKKVSSFLKYYTKFFNKTINEGHKFVFDDYTLRMWNEKCLMAYIATWNVRP